MTRTMETSFGPSSSVLLSLYRGLTSAARPAASLLLHRRAARGKEVPERMSERMGVSKISRPEGPLLWFHAASVGETTAILPLISELEKRFALTVLLTTVTVTSAKVAAARLPANSIHQFVPLDTPQFVQRFLDHWRPDVGFFTESEIWPNLILEASARKVPLMLLNARMSERSFKRWSALKSISRPLFSKFDLVLSQDQDIATRISALGAKQAVVTGNLKYDAPPPPVDVSALDALRSLIKDRPVFLAASTHPGEDEAILRTHGMLQTAIPQLFTIIAPRHPERGEDIAALAAQHSAARRSQHQSVTSETRFYIADTIGELGLFYSLSPIAFIGGSLVAHGGQNPIEAIKLDCGILSGPHTYNFVETYQALRKSDGCQLVSSPEELAVKVRALFENPSDITQMKNRATQAIGLLGGALGRTLEAITPLIPASAYQKQTNTTLHAT